MLACRSREKAEEAIDQIKKKSQNDNIHFVPLDLNDLDSVDGMLEIYATISINNAINIKSVPKYFWKKRIN